MAEPFLVLKLEKWSDSSRRSAAQHRKGDTLTEKGTGKKAVLLRKLGDRYEVRDAQGVRTAHKSNFEPPKKDK